MKIEIEITHGFSKENYDALKVMLDMYVGEFIKADSRATSYNPYPNLQNSNEMNFVVNFTKTPFVQYE